MLLYLDGKPRRYITYFKVNSAFHPSKVGKLSTTSLSGSGEGGAQSPLLGVLPWETQWKTNTVYL